jgi:hypothetical protein
LDVVEKIFFLNKGHQSLGNVFKQFLKLTIRRNEEEKSKSTKPVNNNSNNNSNSNGSRVSNSRPGRADKEERVDRQAAMQKISDTFGYGEGKKTTYQRPAPVASGSGGPGPAERKQLAAESALAHKNKIQQVKISQLIFYVE